MSIAPYEGTGPDEPTLTPPLELISSDTERTQRALGKNAIKESPRNLYEDLLQRAANQDTPVETLDLAHQQQFVRLTHVLLTSNIDRVNAARQLELHPISPRRVTKALNYYYNTFAACFTPGKSDAVLEERRQAYLKTNMTNAYEHGHLRPEIKWAMRLESDLRSKSHETAADSMFDLLAAYGWALRRDFESTDGGDKTYYRVQY